MPAKLLFSKGSDWFYATGLRVSDARAWLQAPSGETHAIISALELGEVQGNTQVNHWHTVRDLGESWTEAIQALCHKVGGGSAKSPLQIPSDFPAGLLMKLMEEGLLLSPVSGPFFPQRMVKTAEEIAHLRAAQALNEQGMRLAQTMLTESTIQADGTLALGGAPLTSERIQGEMNAFYVKNGCTAFDGGPIVASGVQGASPHERGHGVLKANELVVIDTFPQAASGYWGDLSRTFLKGTPSPWHIKLYEVVLAAQEQALASLKAGVVGHDVQAACQKFFKKAGYETGVANGLPYGYFHGLGHSVGLEVHDPSEPMLTKAGVVMQAGMVVTVEPGLYYSENINGGIGGVRIEDVVVITENGIDNLTTYPKDHWILA